MQRTQEVGTPPYFDRAPQPAWPISGEQHAWALECHHCGGWGESRRPHEQPRGACPPGLEPSSRPGSALAGRTGNGRDAGERKGPLHGPGPGSEYSRRGGGVGSEWSGRCPRGSKRRRRVTRPCWRSKRGAAYCENRGQPIDAVTGVAFAVHVSHCSCQSPAAAMARFPAAGMAEARRRHGRRASLPVGLQLQTSNSKRVPVCARTGFHVAKVRRFHCRAAQACFVLSVRGVMPCAMVMCRPADGSVPRKLVPRCRICTCPWPAYGRAHQTIATGQREAAPRRLAAAGVAGVNRCRRIRRCTRY